MKTTFVNIVAAAAVIVLTMPLAWGQDIRGLETCTAEKQMERRTGCLQSNVEFLHQALLKTTRENQQRITAMTRELSDANSSLAAASREIASLKDALTKLQAKVEELEKAKTEKK